MRNNENNIFKFGKTSRVAYDFFKNSNAFINIADGTVRSGKTITCNARWIRFLAQSEYSEFLISGRTVSTIRRNVLTSLFQMLNGENIEYTYNRGDNELIIDDKVCYIIGFNDEASQDVIAGMTIGGWYADELTRCPKSAVEMAISRCSLPNSKMFWNMNPDSPYHFLYTDYITNTDLLERGIVKRWHFTLEDNLNLPEEYVENLKQLYDKNGVFYKRNILGEWSSAEGVIYDQFTEAENVFHGDNQDITQYNEVNICCDYGVSTVTVFGVMAVKYDENGNEYRLLEEDYYDAEVIGITQTDNERVDTIVKLQDKYKLTSKNVLFLPHDASSLKSACQKDHRVRMRVQTYMPDLLEDIKVIQQLFADNKFLIHDSCKESIKQAQTYSWDIKASQRGEDKPIKENDHACDMWRGGILGSRRIKSKLFGLVEL